MNSFLIELSTIESIGMFIVFGAIMFGYSHLPRLPAGGRGISLKDINTNQPAQHTNRSGRTVCPRCRTGNGSVYTCCSNCVDRL